MEDPPDGSGTDRETRRRLDGGSASSTPPGCPDPNRLAAYLDGTASGQERDEVDTHLLSCPKCLGALRELRSFLGAGPFEVPADVVRRAKALVWGPGPDARPTVVPLPSLRARPARLLREAAAWTAAAAVAVLLSLAGHDLGRYACRDRHAAFSVLSSETSFGLTDPGGPLGGPRGIGPGWSGGKP